MNNIIKISKKYKLKVIEDCAQSQGAKFNNKFVGTFGSLGCFSFYPTKILGGYGDGGFILTGVGFGEGDSYLVKTDGNGNIEWSHNYSFPFNTNNFNALLTLLIIFALRID